LTADRRLRDDLAPAVSPASVSRSSGPPTQSGLQEAEKAWRRATLGGQAIGLPALPARRVAEAQHAGVDRGDDPTATLEERALKHRPVSATRPVPAAPPLVCALRWHVAAYGYAPDGRLFFVAGHGDKTVSKWTYNKRVAANAKVSVDAGPAPDPARGQTL
jgi:hypothetical protein